MKIDEIGKIIRDRRKFLNITQKDLAEIVNVGLRSLVDVESGKGNPTIDQLYRILNALGMNITVKVK